MSSRITPFRSKGELFRISLVQTPVRRQVVKVLDENYQNPFAKRKVDKWRKVLEIELGNSTPHTVEEIKSMINWELV